MPPPQEREHRRLSPAAKNGWARRKLTAAWAEPDPTEARAALQELARKLDRLNIDAANAEGWQVSKKTVARSTRLNVGPAKTAASVRTIPVSAPLVQVLERHLGALGLSGDDLVFPGPGGATSV